MTIYCQFIYCQFIYCQFIDNLLLWGAHWQFGYGGLDDVDVVLQSLLFEFDPSARRDAVAIQVQRVQAREYAAYSRVTKHGRSLGITVVCDVENRQIGETSVILGGTDERLHAVDVNTYKAQVQPLKMAIAWSRSPDALRSLAARFFFFTFIVTHS